ncbi:MAG: hypothetical protein ACMG6H_02135 [Acidobacteriota bacterium]
MLRAIVAVIVSYILMFVLIFLSFTCVYYILGAAGSFKPGSFAASNRWIAIAFVVNFVVAVIGGLICATIAKGGKAPIALAAVVFVLGLLLAVPSLMVPKTDAVRAGEVPMFEAMQKAKEPLWAPLALPFVGAIGVLVGGKLKRRS